MGGNIPGGNFPEGRLMRGNVLGENFPVKYSIERLFSDLGNKGIPDLHFSNQAGFDSESTNGIQIVIALQKNVFLFKVACVVNLKLVFTD